MDSIRVQATDRGFYLQIRNEGDIFSIPEDLFSETWMKPADGESAEPVLEKPSLAGISATPIEDVPDDMAQGVTHKAGPAFYVKHGDDVWLVSGKAEAIAYYESLKG